VHAQLKMPTGYPVHWSDHGPAKLPLSIDCKILRGCTISLISANLRSH
jgi:hypothetical protein